MSTKFPDNIQTFGRFQDMTYNDWEMLSQYRQAMADSDFATAQQALRGISKLKNKLLTNGFMNDMLDTCYAVQDFFDNRQVPDYVVGPVQPISQKQGDLWFETDRVPVGSGYITFSSPTSFTIRNEINAKTWGGHLYYSKDSYSWTEWDGTEISSGKTNCLYIKGTGNRTLTTYVDNVLKGKWIISGQDVSCSGSMGDVVDYLDPNVSKTKLSYDCFSSLFYKQSALISAPELPFTNIQYSNGCYAGMFNGTSITKAPDLPATILSDHCYAYMFEKCEKLISPPKISATTFEPSSCFWMFSDCTSLEKIPKILGTTFGSYSCYEMFSGCSKIKISETKTGEYQTEYRIPDGKDGTTTSQYSFLGMFANTGGTFTGTPKINTTYYTSNEVI
mgnify:CR=1 FL=1